MGEEAEAAEQEALRLKSLAETKYRESKLKSALKYAKRAQSLSPNLDGISEIVTSFKILHVGSRSSTAPDWYKILQVEPFAHVNTIKKQYKKLALILHPDKNQYVGSEEAFKLVGEAFSFLSDKVRRKEYDMKLRIRMQEDATAVLNDVETFWTACSTCRLLHKFEKKYVGHHLVCPICKKSFKAVEVEDYESGGQETRSRERSPKLINVDLQNRSRVRRFRNEGFKGIERSDEKLLSLKEKMRSGKEMGGGNHTNSREKSTGDGGDVRNSHSVGVTGNGEWSGGRLRSRVGKRRMSNVDDLLERSDPKRDKTGEAMMTLAEMQAEVKRKAQDHRMKSMVKEKGKEQGEKTKGKENGRHEVLKTCENNKKRRSSRKSVRLVSKEKNLGLEFEKLRSSSNGDLEVMAVEDSDFYDFDKDRVERSFKKGQVWAIYDDDDGMPRNYGLVDEVISLNPFALKISWLDLVKSGDEGIISWEEMGFHISCGRFKIFRTTSIDLLNIFSHVVNCERAARDVYRIYPKKGSVWALYGEAKLGEMKATTGKRRCYHIVVVLTSYSDIHGLSIGYLEKVDGLKTIFRRKQIGFHAVTCLENDDIRLFSHQIPAQKLSGDDIPELLKDCWELDPASLPSDLLAIQGG